MWAQYQSGELRFEPALRRGRAAHFTAVATRDYPRGAVRQEDFDGLVRRLGQSAESTPGLYRLRVAAFAALGYVVYFSLMVATLGLVVGIGAFMLLKPSLFLLKLGWQVGIPLVVFLGVMVKALKVSVPEPQGLPVERHQAPALFAIIDAVSKRLDVPRLEAVLLTEDYNAAVVQVPRFGLLGTKSYLMLGIPLLLSHSKEDVTAVIAHEFGHLSGNHSRFSGWVYRSVRSYAQVLDAVEGNRLLERFLNWYVPRLDALSFPLRRKNEYEADAASAEVVGTERAGQALTNVHVRAALEPSFWEGIKKKVHQTPHPPADLFFDWEHYCKSQSPEDAATALEQALEEETGTTDTHPSLSDRLNALGVSPKLEQPSEPNAARALLGDQYRYFVEQMGFRWSAGVHEGWTREHQRLAATRQRVQELEQLGNQRPLDVDEAFELADKSEDVHLERDPLPLYQAVLALAPSHVGARFAAARLLLQRGDTAGVELAQGLERDADPKLRMHVNAMLASFHARRGDENAAKESLARGQQAFETELRRERAREALRTNDTFAPPALSDEELRKLRETLELFPQVRRAYLVRKLIDGEVEGYVLALDVGLKERVVEDETLVRRVLDAVTLPGHSWCIRLDQNRAFRKPITRVPNALVFEA